MSEDESTTPPEEWAGELYKVWKKVGTIGRFLTIAPWMEAGKVSIDIGETGEGGLKSNTKCFASLLSLTTYLQAVCDNQAAQLYPADDKKGVPTQEGFVAYGGANTPQGPVARLVKIHYWGTGEKTYDARAFAWKTGCFKAKTSTSGAFIADMSQVLSINSIKVSRVEMAEMALVLQLALVNHAAHAPFNQWIRQLHGKDRTRDGQ